MPTPTIRPAASRLYAALLALGLGVVTATCQLGELVSPGRPAVLSVTPLLIADSAPVGSTAPRILTAALQDQVNTDSIPWSVRAALASPWLKVTPTTGTAPGSASLTLDPSGLAAGSYRDTLIFTIVGGAASPIAVPVEFRITGCRVTSISPTVTLQDSLTAADCGAPGRPGRAARLFGFTATAGDSISVRLFTAAFDGYLLLDTVPGSPPLSQNDTCSAGATDPCLSYVLLPRTGSYVIEATTAGAGASGPFRLDVLRPRPPGVPDTLRQFLADLVTPVALGGSLSQTTIVLRASVSDPDFDSSRVEAEVRPLGTTFSNAATQISALVASGQVATVTVSGLSDDTGYHWQARTVDRTGRASAWLAFGGNAETAADFRVAIPELPAIPAAMTQLRSNGSTVIPVGGSADAATALVQAQLSDPDPGDQLRLEIEVQPLGTAFANAATGSSAPVANGGTATAPITGLIDNVAYHWQARTVDQTGRASAWTSFGGNAESAADFRVAIAPSRLTVLVQPSAVVAGAAIAPAVQVAAQDAAGNTLASFTGTVAASVGAGPPGATLSGATSSPAVSGVATFSALALDRAGSGYTLILTAAGVTVTTGAFSVQPGAAARLGFLVQPADAVAGAALVPAVEVEIRDAFGNRVSGATDVVSMSLGSNPAGGTLSGTLSVGAVAGVATFSTLNVNRAATAYRLAASSGTLTGATSGTFDIRAGALSVPASAVTVSNTIVPSGSVITVTLLTKDALGNNLTAGGLTNVAFTVGGGTSTGTLGTVTDNGNGSYATTFTGVTSGSATTIGATIGGTAVGGTRTVAVTPGPVSAAASPVTVAQGAVVAGGTTTITLRARDAAGNILLNGGATVTFGLGAGTSTGTISSVVDNGSGAYSATFTGQLAGSPRGITATINGANVTTPLPTIQVTPGPASTATSTLSVAPATLSLSGTSSATITLQTMDAFGNAANDAGLTVTFTPSGGALESQGTIGPVSYAGGGRYVATFTGTAAGAAATISATINAAAVAATATVTVNP